MAKITTFGGKKLNRVPRHIKPVANLFLDTGFFRVYHADFWTPDGVICGLSIDQETWIEAVKEDGKFLIGALLPHLSKRDLAAVKRAGFLY